MTENYKNNIIVGDAGLVLKTIPSNEIDLIVTSPPYDQARTYETKKLEWDYKLIAAEMYRVLKPGGILCWNVNDMVVDGSETLTSCEQKIFFRRQCGFLIHDTMIYYKTNFSNPEKSRYQQLFEYIFVLSKGKPKTFNPIRDKRNTWHGTQTFGRNTYTEVDGTKTERKKNTINLYGMRGNVWQGKTRGQEDMFKIFKHPAMMPKWLARDLIYSFSNAGDIVMDPFCGSGTTVIEAMKQNREYLGIERNREYVDTIVLPEIKKQELKGKQLTIERM